MKVIIVYFDDTRDKEVPVNKGIDVIGDMVFVDDSEIASQGEDDGPLVDVMTGKPCMVRVLP